MGSPKTGPIVTSHVLVGLRLEITWQDVAGRQEPIGLALTAVPPRALTKQDLRDIPLSDIAQDRRQAMGGGRASRRPSERVVAHLEAWRAHQWEAGQAATGRRRLPPGHFEWVAATAQASYQVGRLDWVTAVALAPGCPCGHEPGLEVRRVGHARHGDRFGCTVGNCNQSRVARAMALLPDRATNYKAAAYWVAEARRRGLSLPPVRGQ